VVNNNSVAHWNCEWIWDWYNVGCALRYTNNDSCTVTDADHCRGAYGTNTVCTSEKDEYHCKAVWWKWNYSNNTPLPCSITPYSSECYTSCCKWNDNRKCYLNNTSIDLSYCTSASLSPG
jgi:hypothetical protein